MPALLTWRIEYPKIVKFFFHDTEVNKYQVDNNIITEYNIRISTHDWIECK
jgi:hypothetical protein